jgi:hypothetical protein
MEAISNEEAVVIDPDEVVLYCDPKHPANAATVVAIDSAVISHLADIARPVGFSDSQFELIAIDLIRDGDDRIGFVVAQLGAAHR